MPEEKDQYEIELQEPEKAEKSAEPEIEIVEEEEIQPKLAKEEVIDPEEGIHDLKNKLLAEQRMRVEAERRAREAVQRQYQAQNETEDANFMLVESAIKTVMSQAEEIKAQYKEALAVGDYDRVTELQEALAENKVNLSELRKGHDYMKRQREQGQKTPPQEYSAQDPVEALASRLSSRSADWIRRNPQFATDQRLFQKMVAAHQMVTADGIEPDSDEYFETVEGILKVRQPTKPAKRVEPEPEEDAMSEAAKPTQRRAAPPAAPVSRSSGGPGTTRSNAIKLTRAEVEAARDMGMTELAYWENKQLLKKEGRI
jgi:hypothetical protein